MNRYLVISVCFGQLNLIKGDNIMISISKWVFDKFGLNGEGDFERMGRIRVDSMLETVQAMNEDEDFQNIASGPCTAKRIKQNILRYLGNRRAKKIYRSSGFTNDLY